MNYSGIIAIIICLHESACRKGEEWKKIRSGAAKQVVPRRVYNFVEPLSVIAEELMCHMGSLKDESGNVHDIRHEVLKWAFQGQMLIFITGSLQ